MIERYAVGWILLLQLHTTQAHAQNATSTFNDKVESIFGSVDSGIDLPPAVVALLSIVVGLLICFFGYRMFRPIMFIAGFVVGGLLVSSTVEALFEDKPWHQTAVWISFVVAGLVMGCLVLVLYKPGLFFVGATAGVFLAHSIHTKFGLRLIPDHPTLGFIALAAVCGLVGGLLTMFLEKPILVTATSLVGAELMVCGIGYFAKDYPIGPQLSQLPPSDDKAWLKKIPPTWWAYLIGILILSLLGMYVQFRFTARNLDKDRKQKQQKKDAAGYWGV